MAADGSLRTIDRDDFEIRRDPMVVERFYDRELSGRDRLLSNLSRFGRHAVRLAPVSLFLVPLQLWALVTLDLPLAVFDRLSPSETLTASTWLSGGEGLLMLALLGTLLINRRVGAARTSAAVLVAWLITLAAFLAVLIELAPELEQSDFPSWRFSIALLGSWIIAPMVALAAYDYTRGGAWWKAPFFGALIGLLAQGLIYFPGAFHGSATPWVWWLGQHVLISLVVSAAFILVYVPFRGLIRPGRGLGGR